MAISLDDLVAEWTEKLIWHPDITSDLAVTFKVDHRSDNVVAVARSASTKLVGISLILRRDIEDNVADPMGVVSNLASVIGVAKTRPVAKSAGMHVVHGGIHSICRP